MNERIPQFPDDAAPGHDAELDEWTFEKKIDEGQACIDLGLYEEAEEVLEEVPPESSLFVHAQNLLLRIDHDLARFEQGAERGFALLCTFGPDCVIFQTFANCLLFLERYDDARQVARLREDQNFNNCNCAYTVACIETKRGNFAAALRWLRRSMELSKEHAVYALFDCHLTALWRRIGRLRIELDAELVTILAAPVFVKVAAIASIEHGVMGYDHEASRALPSRLRRALVIDPMKGLHVPDPQRCSRDKGLRLEFSQWGRRRILRSLAGLIAGLKVAAEQQQRGPVHPFEKVVTAVAMTAQMVPMPGLN